jgi:glycine betaine/proline transport system substrate-binding protein
MKKRILIAVLACLSLLLVLTASVPAAAKTVMFADLSWDSIQFHNRVVAFLLEKGWGYKAEYTFSETMPGYLGLERGDIDIILEVWTDAQKEWWEKAQKSGKVHNAGSVFPNAVSGWYVPRYVIEGDLARNIRPAAPELKSVEDVKKYWEIFKNRENPKMGRFYNAPTGWSAHTINLNKIKAYGLKEILEPFDPGSGTALATAIKAAFDRGIPVIAYYWEPTPLLGMLDMVRIEEPPHDPEVWAKNNGCSSPAYFVAKAINVKWLDANREVLGLIERYFMTLEQTNQALAWMQANDNDAKKAAVWFLRENADQWKGWVQDEERIGLIEKALQ